MTPPQLQQLKDVIVKANPSLLDLKMGCEIISLLGVYRKVIKKDDNDNYIAFAQIGGITYNIERSDIKEIVGSPIQLQHVLIAIEKVYSLTKKDDWGLSVGSYPVAELLEKCDLTKPFEEWSDECLDFLHKLLVKNYEK
jgi:hypothetical protein